MALHNWRREDAEAVECLLRGDHKEHQPFLEAAKKGNIELIEFFLQQGANHLQRT
jgi:ankyrin repeat protein